MVNLSDFRSSKMYVMCYLTVVLICISLMTNGVECVFMSLLAICFFFFFDGLFRCFAHFKNQIAFVILIFECSLYSEHKMLITRVICRYFFTVYRLYFHSHSSFLRAN